MNDITPAPNIPNQKELSLFNSVMIVGSSALAIAYLLKSLPKEKNYIWGAVGWMALGGAWYGGLKGVSGIIYYYSE